MYLLVRVRGDVAQVTTDVKTELRRLEPDLIVDRVQTMESRLRASLASRRVNTFLLGAFGIFAAGLAGVAIYGLMAYTVSVRAREFGIRLALGAARTDVIVRVLGGAMRLAVLGVGDRPGSGRAHDAGSRDPAIRRLSRRSANVRSDVSGRGARGARRRRAARVARD